MPAHQKNDWIKCGKCRYPIEIVRFSIDIFDRITCHNGWKVVVKQNNVGRLLRNVRSDQTHRHSDVGSFQGRTIVDAVSGDRHNFAQFLTSFHDQKFLLRRSASENDFFVKQSFVQLLFRKVFQFRTGHHNRFGLSVEWNTNCEWLSIDCVRTLIQIVSKRLISFDYLCVMSAGCLPRRVAISSRVSWQMMPTVFPIAVAVIGWSPVTIITWFGKSKKKKSNGEIWKLFFFLHIFFCH